MSRVQYEVGTKIKNEFKDKRVEVWFRLPDGIYLDELAALKIYKTAKQLDPTAVAVIGYDSGKIKINKRYLKLFKRLLRKILDDKKNFRKTLIPEPTSKEEAQKEFSEGLKEFGIELEKEDWEDLFSGHTIYIATRDGIARIVYDGVTFRVDRIVQEKIEVDEDD
jgi:hypothetical protein